MLGINASEEGEGELTTLMPQAGLLIVISTWNDMPVYVVLPYSFHRF